MVLILAAVAILLINGIFALLFRRNAKVASGFGVAGPVLALGAGIVPAIRILSGGAVDSIDLSWGMPETQAGLKGKQPFPKGPTR